MCLVDSIDFNRPVPDAREYFTNNRSEGLFTPIAIIIEGIMRGYRYFFQNTNWGKRGSEAFSQYLSMYI